MTAPPRDGDDLMRAFLPTETGDGGSPFVTYVGAVLTEVGDGAATLVLPFRQELATIGSVVHGGAIATLIDTAAMAAAWSGAPIPEQARGSTVSLSVSYVAPADGCDLTATARIVRRGRRLVPVQVDVHSPDGSAVATALVTYQLG